MGSPAGGRNWTACRSLRDVASDQLNHGLEATLIINRDTASRLGITPQTIDDTLYDAFGQRLVSTIFTQLNQYHVVLEVDPRYQQNPDSLKHIYVHTSSGAQVPLSAFTHFEPSTTPLAINHQGQFPVSDIVVQSRARSFAWRCGRGDQESREANWASCQALTPVSRARPQAFQSSLANEPFLILAALVTVYIVLGVLYESYIHPITILSTLPSAGVGAILALLICRYGFQRHRVNRHHPPDRHREEERHYDDRLCARSGARARQESRGVDLSGSSAAFPADHDDDDGGALRRPAAGAGAGTGSELRRPLGITIVGGLLVSQILTLYTTPVVYIFFDRLAMRFRRRRQYRKHHCGAAGRGIAREYFGVHLFAGL